jgi:hypothetical protein
MNIQWEYNENEMSYFYHNDLIKKIFGLSWENYTQKSGIQMVKKPIYIQ